MLIGSDWSVLRGALFTIPFTGGGSCPSTLPPVHYEWTKADAGLTAGEQSDVAAVRTMLQGKLDAEEACSDLRDVRYWQMTLDGSGFVQSVTAWLNGPTVGGVQRQMWARWSKQRTGFSVGERSDLDAVVSFLGDYLIAEEPLP
jgi:hypothetical protein